MLTNRGIFSRSGGLKEVKNTAVKKVGEKYRCHICRNEITVTRGGGGTLVCCGTTMVKIEEKLTPAGKK